MILVLVAMKKANYQVQQKCNKKIKKIFFNKNFKNY